jgi:hypothetical protein
VDAVRELAPWRDRHRMMPFRAATTTSSVAPPGPADVRDLPGKGVRRSNEANNDQLPAAASTFSTWCCGIGACRR